MTQPIFDIEKQSIKEAIKPPKKWNVIFYNDDFTSFEFVIQLLMQLFGKTEQQGIEIAQSVHVNQKAVVASYTKEIAQTKQHIGTTIAIESGFPLKIEIEEA